jgi:peptidoglycan/LPS O-acetylase OafA/YrhL
LTANKEQAPPNLSAIILVSSKTLPQIPALTGLRFIAAALILVPHAIDWLGHFSDSDITNYFVFLSMYGMPLFFVLSGFVIHYNYRNLFITRPVARATAEFAAARFARLFPLYFYLLLASICVDHFLSEVHGDRGLFIRIMAYYGTLTQSWWYVVYENKLLINWLFGLSWSISTEAFFYVAYVPAVLALVMIRRTRAIIFAVVAYAVIVTCAFVGARHSLLTFLVVAERYVPNYIGPSNYYDDFFQNSFYRWFFYFSPYTRMFEFFMGALTAHLFMLTVHRPSSLLERRLTSFLVALAVAFLAVAGLLYLKILMLGPVNVYVQLLSLNFLCAPALAVIIFYVARGGSWLTSMLSVSWVVTLGDTSYSIYLLHYFILRIFGRAPPPISLTWGLETILRVSCGVSLTLLAAYATYRLIEVPSRNWLRQKLGHFIEGIFGHGPVSVGIADPGVVQPAQN